CNQITQKSRHGKMDPEYSAPPPSPRCFEPLSRVRECSITYLLCSRCIAYRTSYHSSLLGTLFFFGCALKYYIVCQSCRCWLLGISSVCTSCVLAVGCFLWQFLTTSGGSLLPLCLVHLLSVSSVFGSSSTSRLSPKGTHSCDIALMKDTSASVTIICVVCKVRATSGKELQVLSNGKP
ncbi:unnamed protein product, partial [Choristocarpus tenellus]